MACNMADPIAQPLPPSPSSGPHPPARSVRPSRKAHVTMPVPLMTTMPCKTPSVPEERAATESL
jgi:hypothetical protein